jgi:hypothetical protein
MKKKESYPLQKVTLNLREGDWEWLKAMHGKIGASKVIREIIIAHCERAKSAAQQSVKDIQLEFPLDSIIEGVKNEA